MTVSSQNSSTSVASSIGDVQGARPSTLENESHPKETGKVYGQPLRLEDLFRGDLSIFDHTPTLLFVIHLHC